MVKNLEYIARSAMFYLKKPSDQDYAHFLQYAKHWYTEVMPHDGLRRLGVFYGKLDKLSRLSLPPDFVMYTRVGVLSDNRVYTLTLDPTIAMIPVPACLEGLSETDGVNQGTDSTVAAYPYMYQQWGMHYTPFGRGGARNYGYYRPDLPNNVIYFDSTLKDMVVVLEYISNGGDLTGSTRVMEAYVLAGIKFCMWQDIEYDLRVPMAERERRKMDYLSTVSDANYAANSNLIDEILDAIYTSAGDKMR